jgi:catechol 2,3-dioxygenase-like lactoylglutathione lyase family enzyme
MADPFLRVHAVNIYVRDQARSLDFYLNTLGFHIAYDARVGSGERLLAVAPPDGSAVLTLIQARPDTPQARFVGRATQVVFVTEDLPATYTEWRRRGVRFQNAPRLRRVVYDRTGDAADPSPPPSTEQDRSAWGGAFTRFEDVDRNSFSLVSFDEVSRAVEAQRRAAAEKQEAERRAAQELEIAMQVQSRLFPQRLPPMRTLEYAGACVQTHRVGGDYYDFLDLGQDRLGLVIGDIAGKGMPAAGQSSGESAQSMRHGCRAARALSADREPAFLREHCRQCLRDLFLFGVRRSRGTAALRELRTFAGAGAATRRRGRTP